MLNVIIFLASPGSGKGTQAAKLSNALTINIFQLEIC